jgi:hypothetical protein
VSGHLESSGASIERKPHGGSNSPAKDAKSLLGTEPPDTRYRQVGPGIGTLAPVLPTRVAFKVEEIIHHLHKHSGQCTQPIKTPCSSVLSSPPKPPVSRSRYELLGTCETLISSQLHSIIEIVMESEIESLFEIVPGLAGMVGH